MSTSRRLLDFAIGAYLVSTLYWLVDHDFPWPVMSVLAVICAEVTWRAWHYVNE